MQHTNTHIIFTICHTHITNKSNIYHCRCSSPPPNFNHRGFAQYNFVNMFVLFVCVCFCRGRRFRSASVVIRSIFERMNAYIIRMQKSIKNVILYSKCYEQNTDTEWTHCEIGRCFIEVFVIYLPHVDNCSYQIN